jgi:hypothetical protein
MAQRRRSSSRSEAAFALAIAAGAWITGCLSAPRPTEEAVRRSRNTRALVEGVVRDETGVPVAGIEVIGLPRQRDLLWSPPATTDAEGRFQLALDAPGEYGLLLSWRGITVITPREDDPSRIDLILAPGEKRVGVLVRWWRGEWEKQLEESGQRLPGGR